MNDKLLKKVYDEIDKLKPIILFDNPNGTPGDITISSSAANFSKIEVCGYFNNSDVGKPVVSNIIYNPNNKYFILFGITIVDGTFQVCSKRFYISGTSITGSNGGYQNLNGDLVPTGTSIVITKVIGYK